MKNRSWKGYTVEFLSIFIAVISAFGLNNWNDYRRDRIAEQKILTEIANGLQKDYEDVEINIVGHEYGLKACNYWRRILLNQETNQDTLSRFYTILFRDFISIQNISGYEALKSRGFELIKNDSLRKNIIELYEFDYQLMRKLEEDYNESQFHQNYFAEFNQVLAPQFSFNEQGEIDQIALPLKLPNATKNILLSYLTDIQYNRQFNLKYQRVIKEKITVLKTAIEQALGKL